jgi:hypothetical protein
LQTLILGLLFFLFLPEIVYARQTALLTWDDNSENEEGFVVERTVSDNCIGGWEIIGYTGANENYFEDVYIPGACYRVAAYDRDGLSAYSNTARQP